MRTALCLALFAAGAGAQINVGSFDTPRSRLPFASATGNLGPRSPIPPTSVREAWFRGP
jgi:hypothetical protein